MIDGPLGGAAFNNEFGRPNLAGYFRVYEQSVGSGAQAVRRGYHKPIMIAGGLGAISAGQTRKKSFPAGTLLIQLGARACASAWAVVRPVRWPPGRTRQQLDFDSVQRGNPEIERRAQEVINHCWALGESNPILAIHDVGAGGLSNAFPELVHGAGVGARFDLRSVPLEETGLAPKEVWCNESQERYVLAVAPHLCRCCRRCASANVARLRSWARPRPLSNSCLKMGQGAEPAIDMPLEVLLGKPPKMLRDVRSRRAAVRAFDIERRPTRKGGVRCVAPPDGGEQALPHHDR